MEIHEHIADIKAELNYLDKHRDILRNDKKILTELEIIKKLKEEQLSKENKDVERLENTSISSLFHTIIGQKESKLEKEKLEAAEASIQYHKVLNEYQMKKKDIERLEARFSQEESLREKLRMLQLEVMKHENFEHREYLEKHIQEYEIYKNYLKEIDEALQAGYQLKSHLEEAIKYLKKAQDWGIFDMMGGDFFSGIMKHNRIDQAQELLQEAKYKLQKFQKELKDLQDLHFDIISINGSLLVFDYIFDNIFTDWIVQSKINKSVKNIEDSYQQVNQLLNDLEKKQEKIQYQCEKSHEVINDLLNKI